MTLPLLTEENRKFFVHFEWQKINDLSMELYGINIGHSRIEIDITGRYAGLAEYDPMAENPFLVKLNKDIVFGEGFYFILNNTLPHEAAHLVCCVDPSLGDNHDEGWKKVCKSLGGTGGRLHDVPFQYKFGSVKYETTEGYIVALSQIRHKRIQHEGYVYEYKGKGQIDKTCPFSVVS